MKKWLILLVVLLFAGGGGYYFATHMQKSPAQSGQTSQNPFDSIKDALSKSLSLQCSFTDEQGRQTTVYVKAGAVRVNSIAKDPNEENGQTGVIMKNNMLYTWDMLKKQGMMMKLQTPSVTGSAVKQPTGTQETSENGKSEDILATIEKYKNSCKPAVVDSSLFNQPTDVKFMDMSQMMQMQVTGMPTGGAGAPSQMNQEQINQMMQQYKNQMPPTSSGQ